MVIGLHLLLKLILFLDKLLLLDSSLKIREDLNNDFFYINESNTDKVIENVLTLCKDRLKSYGDYEFFKNIQVITPTKKGSLGTEKIVV